MTLNDYQTELCESHDWDFSGLSALFLNCTLKKSPELSHTRGLLDVSAAILQKNGVAVEILRPVDHEIAPGVWPDMTEHGAERDDWPAIYEKVRGADILVLGSPIWLGEKSSVCPALRVGRRVPVRPSQPGAPLRSAAGLHGRALRVIRVGRIPPRRS